MTGNGWDMGRLRGEKWYGSDTNTVLMYEIPTKTLI